MADCSIHAVPQQISFCHRNCRCVCGTMHVLTEADESKWWPVSQQWSRDHSPGTTQVPRLTSTGERDCSDVIQGMCLCVCMCACMCICLCVVIQYLSRNVTDMQLSQQLRQQMSAGLFEMSANSRRPLVCTSHHVGSFVFVHLVLSVYMC